MIDIYHVRDNVEPIDLPDGAHHSHVYHVDDSAYDDGTEARLGDVGEVLGEVLCGNDHDGAREQTYRCCR